MSDTNPNTIRAALFPESIKAPNDWQGPFWAVEGRHGWMKKRSREEAVRDARIGNKKSAPRSVVRVYVDRSADIGTTERTQE